MSPARLRYSPQMTTVITQLAARYDVDLQVQGTCLSLAMSGRYERWLIASLSAARISVTHCWVEGEDELSPDLDMVFAVSAAGWEPLEIVYADEVWHAYVQAAEAIGIPIYQANGDTCFVSFTEYWAQQLHQQGWLIYAYPVAMTADIHGAELSPPPARFAGCQSSHPGPCYGELWRCAACRKTICFAEGTDHHPELCDDCWAKADSAQEEDQDVPF